VHQIGEVEDIDEASEAKLTGLEIRTTDDLLARAATPAGREELASAIAVDAKEILRWANCADLMRVDGIGMQFADLLEAAGIDTIPELAQRNPANLLAKLEAVNAQGKLTGRAPSSAEVEGWIVQAKGLPRILVYGGGAAAAPAVSGSAGRAVPAAPSASAPAPAPAPASAPAAANPAASPAKEAVETVAAQAPAGGSAVAGAASDAAAEVADEGTTARGMVSGSADAAPAGSWLQKVLAKVRGRA
jgi:predicted flap endonuclease-1-like 5' DNA nuclease